MMVKYNHHPAFHSELNLQYGNTTFIIEKSHLRKTALVLGDLFLTTVAMRIYGIIIAPQPA